MIIPDDPVMYVECEHDGLTKRELFAAMAMHAMVNVRSRRILAEESVAMADALIEELSK